MTYVEPARTMTPEENEAFLPDAGLNGPFVADLLSDMLAHERCGAQLYRSVSQRTNSPVLRERYDRFGNETVEHVEILEGLVTQLGGDPGYVSPAARTTEKAGMGLLESTFLLSVSVDLMTQELVMLDAVLLAEAKDQPTGHA
jgi:ferritin-like metal-binding protein YciE